MAEINASKEVDKALLPTSNTDELVTNEEAEEDAKAEAKTIIDGYQNGILSTGDIIEILVREYITSLYWSLLYYDNELVSEELTAACEYKKATFALAKPQENMEDLTLIIQLLQTKQNPDVESRRLCALDLVIFILNEELVDFPEVKGLLPVSKKLLLIKKVEKFYSEIDPNDFKNEELGYGQTKKEAFKKDGKSLDYLSIDADPIFLDLHSVQRNQDVPKAKQMDARDLIDELRNYFNDPVRDVVSAMFAEPNKEATYVYVSSRWHDYNGIDYFIQGDQKVKPIGNDLYAISIKDAKLRKMPRNRIIVTTENQQLGIARGPILFVRIDKKKNILPFTIEQTKWLNQFYRKKQTFDERPLSNERAQELITNIANIMLMTNDEYGESTLYGAGFTKQEIQNYKEYFKFKE